MEDDNLTDTTQAVAHGLISMIQQRSTVADQRLAEARRRVNQLQGTVHAREAEIRRIQNANVAPEMPANYEHNGGRVDIQVSSHSNEPEYVVSLYLPSDYSQRPTASLPHWFLELLQARGGAYHTLAEAARGLEHPAAFAEVE